MDITIAANGMPFGPFTHKTKSLGGSETAAIMLAEALADAGHTVTVYSQLLDWVSGEVVRPGLRYCHVQEFPVHTMIHESDMSIIVRDPNLAGMPTISRKKVLWMHDIATKRAMGMAFEAMQWAIDEVWTVSEWHRQQVHTATGYPLSHIVALRNGIVKHDDVPASDFRAQRQLVYAARPERGLDNLIRPGGVMDFLPEYTLKVAMYDHFPEHMRGYYEGIFARMRQMQNVEYVGSLPNAELRQMIGSSEAYIYPTQFEETSCILARECIERGTPIFTTKTGALPETVGSSGVYFEDYLEECGYTEPDKGTQAWARLFAQFVRDGLNSPAVIQQMKLNQSFRDDLYWDGVAAMVEARAPTNADKSLFSLAYSMIEDGAVISAQTLLDNEVSYHFAIDFLKNTIREQYRFLLDEHDPNYLSMGDHYDAIYTTKQDKETTELLFRSDLTQGDRFQAVAGRLASLPAGSNILEFGCGPGHLLGTLARCFPKLNFYGIEISPAAVTCLNEGAEREGLTNIRAVCGGTELLDLDLGVVFDTPDVVFDAAICSEVLEHVISPDTLIFQLEHVVKQGGMLVLTVPFGPWEPDTFRAAGRFHERAHIWHFTKRALKTMFQKKPNIRMDVLAHPQNQGFWMRTRGNYVVSYTPDLEPVNFDFDDADVHNVRQTVAAAIIAYNNEDTILRCLKSIKDQVQVIQIAHGPSADRTRAIIDEFAAAYPYVCVNVIDVPKIEPYAFGFDDARNASVAGLDEIVDWVLWIDTDEYLSGDFTPYLRGNCLDAYIIPQHHFTVEPRGTPSQIDRPARLFRTKRGYAAKGHIHEHFELPEGGPGRAYELPKVDIGHTGYVNEGVRRDRFHRNFAFLEWDHQDPKGRKLHHFLWFRDMIHQLRFAQEQGDLAGGQQIAKAAVAYYNEHWETMVSFGPGFAMSQQYLSEAHMYLGIGVPLRVDVTFQDRQAQLQGQFTDFEQIERLFKFLVQPEMAERLGKYYG